MLIERKRPKALSRKGLRLLYVDRVWSLGAVADLERYGVPNMEIIEGNAYEILGMKEEILPHTFHLDESEAAVSDVGDSSLLHSNW